MAVGFAFARFMAQSAHSDRDFHFAVPVTMLTPVPVADGITLPARNTRSLHRS
jgi:hypothetical protein